MIFEHVFAGSVTPRNRVQRSTGLPNDASMLYTCKALYNEAFAIYWRLVGLDLNHLTYVEARNFCQSATTQQRALIRAIYADLKLFLGGYTLGFSEPSEFAKLFPNLKTFYGLQNVALPVIPAELRNESRLYPENKGGHRSTMYLIQMLIKVWYGLRGLQNLIVVGNMPYESNRTASASVIGVWLREAMMKECVSDTWTVDIGDSIVPKQISDGFGSEPQLDYSKSGGALVLDHTCFKITVSRDLASSG